MSVTINPFYKPQVLLLGNGLNRSYGGTSWEEMLKQIKKRDDLPTELKCPMTLQAVLLTNDNVKNAMDEKKEILYGTLCDKLKCQLQRLLTMGFDDILTTNYSYEIESSSMEENKVTDYFLKKTNKNIMDENIDKKYLIHSYQEVLCNEVPNRIWHIHGEARKTNSMILGYYSYVGLIHNITEHCKKNGNIFQISQKKI